MSTVAFLLSTHDGPSTRMDHNMPRKPLQFIWDLHDFIQAMNEERSQLRKLAPSCRFLWNVSDSDALYFHIPSDEATECNSGGFYPEQNSRRTFRAREFQRSNNLSDWTTVEYTTTQSRSQHPSGPSDSVSPRVSLPISTQSPTF